MCEDITNAEIMLLFLLLISIIITCSAMMRLTRIEADFGRMARSNRFLRDQINRDQAILEPLRKFHEE